MSESFQAQSSNDAFYVCALIPCYNHNDTLARVVAGLPTWVNVLIIDDGSEIPINPPNERSTVLRLEKNSGKAVALQTGFAHARKLGYTHAVALDSDGQHAPEVFDEIASLARETPDAIIAGVRDFSSENVPSQRRFMNKFSNFWFWFETGITLQDTQCGYRCYPIDVISTLNLSESGFVYEAELLVKASWAGIKIVQKQVPCIYSEKSTSRSHYKPFVDTMRFSKMNSKFAFMAMFLTRKRLAKIALKK